ncbi:glutathione S-transferase [Acinetobacter sp. MD2(2019)]|uniref:glutathione S-transferase n=1 Tax=Acinetobacter sp. MD2(2019) TaxID=2605273 RepID=UPI002D1F4B18|nr:glutathione S-transferase [Acinetobacter sp. MD2(2019)]MEB3754286.1 glutathione S-transferase [Acinetobacter sp. MD2(2019)]
MLKILGRPDSINVRKLLWLCDELNLAYAREDWGRGFRSPKDAEFVSMNPNSTIPILIDGEFTLWQSNSIIRYLANAYHGEALYPTQPKQRAIIDQWIDWQGIELNNSWSYALMHIIRQSPEHQDLNQVSASIASWNEMMQILDRQLAKTQAYVAGNEFSLADIAMGLSVQRWYLTPFEKPECAQVKRYYNLLSQRPAFLRWGNNGQN